MRQSEQKKNASVSFKMKLIAFACRAIKRRRKEKSSADICDKQTENIITSFAFLMIFFFVFRERNERKDE